MDQNDITVSVNNHRGGIGRNLHDLFPLRIAGYHREGVAIVLAEIFNRFRLINGVHSHHSDVVAVLGICLLQEWELHIAGLAGNVPEVQHHCLLLLLQLSQTIDSTVHIRDGEIHHHIAQLVGQFLYILHLAGFQDNFRILTGQGIECFHLVAGRHIAEHRHIGIPGKICEGHNTVIIGLVKPNQFFLGFILIDIHAHLRQRNTGCGLHRDRIGHRRTAYSRSVCGIIIVLAAGSHRQQQAQSQYKSQISFQNVCCFQLRHAPFITLGKLFCVRRDHPSM